MAATKIDKRFKALSNRWDNVIASFLKTSLGEQSFSDHGLQLWNGLNKEDISPKTLKAFTADLKKLLSSIIWELDPSLLSYLAISLQLLFILWYCNLFLYSFISNFFVCLPRVGQLYIIPE